MGQPPSYDKYWMVNKINKEGSVDRHGNIYAILVIGFALVGIVFLYEGDIFDGVFCLGIAALGVVVRYWMKRRGRRAPVQVAPPQPKPQV